jgi:hypothetical protein
MHSTSPITQTLTTAITTTLRARTGALSRRDHKALGARRVTCRYQGSSFGRSQAFGWKPKPFAIVVVSEGSVQDVVYRLAVELGGGGSVASIVSVDLASLRPRVTVEVTTARHAASTTLNLLSCVLIRTEFLIMKHLPSRKFGQGGEVRSCVFQVG